MAADPPPKDFRDILARAVRLIASVGGGEQRELPRHYIEVFALFDRCRGILAAVRLLVRADFTHEALMLARPILTDSLALGALAAVDEQRRTELLLGWELDSLAQFRGVMLEGKAQGQDVAEALAALDQRQAQVEAYAREKGSRRREVLAT